MSDGDRGEEWRVNRGCRSQQLSQPSIMSATPGADVRLSCILSPGFSISSERVRWYQQKRDSLPVFVYHYYTSSNQGRGSGIPDRFSVTADTSSNRWNLVIDGVQPEDDADYYCNSYYSSS
ncbi:hypothetical protein NDU88_006788 [Pleurodeles waltl]|uniref:Ig-like domain-containing protein n=1 Tax=Pleurodeles waltl TaxID=8319 RepID=A0AAV7LTI9_PLEWA|nr:hypothetical protein NDU88_006788 [Pleurodeles waltl]